MFGALDRQTRGAIDTWAFEQMPLFSRPNRSLEGARTTLRRYGRSRVRRLRRLNARSYWPKRMRCDWLTKPEPDFAPGEAGC